MILRAKILPYKQLQYFSKNDWFLIVHLNLDSTYQPLVYDETLPIIIPPGHRLRYIADDRKSNKGKTGISEPSTSLDYTLKGENLEPIAF